MSEATYGYGQAPVEAVPRTLSGKKMEVPVKQILSGADPATVVTLSSMANPESLASFVELVDHTGARR